MRKSNIPEMRPYCGRKLYATEARVLEEFEALLGEPIPYSQSLIYSEFGFSSEGTHVTGLLIPGRSLSSLPASLDNLNQLTELYLYDNQLTTIPEVLGNLTQLTVLDLGNN